MDVYGLTGGIGSGKSEVASLLERYGIPVVSADELSRVVVARGSQGLEDVVRLFGPFVLNDEGELDRRRMAAIVFEDPSKRRDLESILHPRIRERFEQVLDALEKAGHAVAVYEVPLLFEKNLQGEMKAVILVTADENTRIRRVQARDDVTEAEVRARIAAQMDEETKRKRADYIIENEGSMDALRREVEFMLDRFMRVGTRRTGEWTIAPPSTRSTEEMLVPRPNQEVSTPESRPEATDVPAIGPPPSRQRTETLPAANGDGPSGPPEPKASVTERVPVVAGPPRLREPVPVRSGHTVIARYPAPTTTARTEPVMTTETPEAAPRVTTANLDDVFGPSPIPAPEPPKIAPGATAPRLRPPRISPPTKTVPVPVARGKDDADPSR